MVEWLHVRRRPSWLHSGRFSWGELRLLPTCHRYLTRTHAHTHTQLIILKYGLLYTSVSNHHNRRPAYAAYTDVREPWTSAHLQAAHTHPNISASSTAQFQQGQISDLHANLTRALQNGWRFNTFNTLAHVKLIWTQYFCKPSNPPSRTSVMHLLISWIPDL